MRGVPVWAWLAWACTAAATNLTTLEIGVMLPWSGWAVGNAIAAVVPMAIESINQSPLMPSGYRLNWTTRDSKCDVGASLEALFEFDRAGTLDAIIGPACSAACEAVAAWAAQSNTPVISYSCMSTTLSNRNAFPTFGRTVSVSCTRSLLL